MKRKDPRIERWLVAEAASPAPERGGEAAEAALASLLVALPRPRPSAGFAERVLMRAGVVSLPQRHRDPFAAAPVRWSVAACLLLAAFSLLLVPRLLWGSLLGASWGGIIRLPIDAVLKLPELVGGSLAVWESFAHVGRILTEVVTRPTVSALLVAALLIATVAFRLLHDLIASNRSWSYVES